MVSREGSALQTPPGDHAGAIPCFFFFLASPLQTATLPRPRLQKPRYALSTWVARHIPLPGASLRFHGQIITYGSTTNKTLGIPALVLSRGNACSFFFFIEQHHFVLSETAQGRERKPRISKYSRGSPDRFKFSAPSDLGPNAPETSPYPQ
ncbi:uncharacterized protein H6S33_000056 [Morchella sextelata]|uniref:uncharacterized protein n=1 Tax=Morchella sextelata TaxID=1174677 RepID=UPI001D0568CB|nr:uncharacterized protein H6S33_000056 [Morchella sextelata]KAH0614420.1 hypothetical protein H6S33_000056 [Morchella sextelata]